ncbi:hypothetical protein ACFUJY_16595 [Streptomyces sp. NPDC057249]|uniref:hypothetical protein n=1 Tax=Streptomyces sp. NPDC057249 TaxID=3346067 RepID=UPI00363F34E5
MGLMSWLRGGRSADAPPPRLPGPPGPGRADRVDVNRLEPVQRSVWGQELLTDPLAFESRLTTRQDTSLGTPLGHLVSPEAPAGLVRGVVDAAPGSPAPPVQRAVEMPMPERSGKGRGAVAVQRTYGNGPPHLTSAGPASASAGVPVRQLVGEQPLLPPDTNTGPVGPAPRADAAEPGAPVPDEPPVQRTATSADGPPPPVPLPPPTRRTGGLGAPLPGLPPTAQRKAVRPPQSPQVQRDGAPPPAHATDPAPGPGASPEPLPPETTGTPDTPSGAEAVAPLLGDAPLKPEGGAPAPDAAADRHHDPAAPVQRTGTPPSAAPGRPTAPLLGDRPLTLRTADAPGDTPAVQRAAESAEGAPGPSPFVPAPPAPPPAVAVRWTATDAGTVPAASGARGVPGARGVQRVASAPAAPSQRGAAPVQRQTAPPPARPQPSDGRGPRVPASVRNAGAFAVAAGVAQRMADGSVVFPSAPRDGTSRPVVQRDSDTAEEPPPPPLPEPDPPPEPDPEPGPEPEPPATEQPAATTGSSVSPDGTPQAPPVTDELVRALYAPLSRLLKADLRLERERSGSLINTRH